MHVLVYMTATSQEEARTISAALVDRRLAACVNILGDIQSLFHWNGSVQNETETAFIAKTTQERLDELTETVRQLHSYDEPCVVAVPMVGGSATFLNWITTETAR